jgi:protein-S-isoprenylcysteine O-methyltransferase Ste14
LKIPPVLVSVIFAALMWLVSRSTPGIDLPATLRVVCLVLFATAGAVIGLSAVVSFKKAQTTVNPLTLEACSSLVDSGMFRFTRNPMYLALLLGLAGWALFLGNVYSLALTALFVTYMNRFQIQPEEQALEAVFGEAFIDYQRRVRRWL